MLRRPADKTAGEDELRRWMVVDVPPPEVLPMREVSGLLATNIASRDY